MKYPSYSQVYQNDPSNNTYDKKTLDVNSLTTNTISDENYIKNIKEEPNMMYI